MRDHTQRPLSSGDRAAFALLAVFLVCMGAFSLAFGLAEGVDSASGDAGLGAFVVASAGALLVWFVVPRIGPRAFDGSLIVTAVVIALSTTAAANWRSQMIAALILLMLGVLTAFFVPLPRMWIILGIQMAIFAIALAVDHHDTTPWSYVVLGVTNVVLAAAVSRVGRSMREEAGHDPLTEVLNRHGFEDQAHLVEALARRAGNRIFVGFLDLDAFKRFNDEHGHDAGDRLLADVAHGWSGALRAGDLLVRWGGDEFVVVLAARSLEEAEAVVSRLRAVHPAPWTYGITEWLDGERIESVIARADAALLSAKARRLPGAVGHSDRGPWPAHWSEARRTRAALASHLDPQVLLEPVVSAAGEVVDFRVVDANPAACAAQGVTLQDIVGVRIRERVPGQPAAWLFDELVRTLVTGVPTVVDGYPFVDPDGPGDIRRVDFRAARYDDALSITWRDVTRRDPTTVADTPARADDR